MQSRYFNNSVCNQVILESYIDYYNAKHTSLYMRQHLEYALEVYAQDKWLGFHYNWISNPLSKEKVFEEDKGFVFTKKLWNTCASGLKSTLFKAKLKKIYKLVDAQ